MKIKTKEDPVKSLKEQKTVIYYSGEPVEDRTTFPAFTPHINSTAKTYELALRPEYEELLTATSNLAGK